MKNIDEYEKYYNAQKNNYDADELSEAKKEKFDYKQCELFDKTDKKLTLDEETKKFFKDNEEPEKIVDKKNLKNILVTNLLHQ